MSKIAIVSAQYLPHVGGVERYTEKLAQYLTKRGHKVTVITSGNGENVEIETGVIDVFRMPAFQLLDGRLPVIKPDNTFRQLTKKLKERQFDYMMINTRFYPLSLWAARFAFKNHIPGLVLDHGSGHLNFGIKGVDWLVEQYEHWISSRIQKYQTNFYGISDKSAQWLGHFQIQAKGTLTNAMEIKQENKTYEDSDLKTDHNGPLKVVFLGRLVNGKGLPHLIEAAKAFNENQLILTIAGDGPLRQQLEKSAPKNVHFTGAVPYEKALEMNEHADVICLPSDSEGFATVLLEAAACQTFIIATDVGGTREITNSDLGIILEDNSPASIIKALIWVLNNRSECQNKAKAASQRVQSEFNWEKTAARVEAALQESKMK